MENRIPLGNRIAKVLSRAGIASRRNAEHMIKEGRISVNGIRVINPVFNISENDNISVDGRPIRRPEPQRLWIYYKPIGLVTTEKDEKERPTVFGNLPNNLPRVMSVGRLDINSEGLLLLTNDGEIKRKLELPSNGWLRKYRVRIKGRPTDKEFDCMRSGLLLNNQQLRPIKVKIDRQLGTNAWLSVGLREGKNREIRKALESIGYKVNRLIRVSFGPFQLKQLKPGELQEVRTHIFKDQLYRM
ncbi:MAG: pseudouridine synthase [Aestuariivita sp.]|nr:pseudouridine synthase [Aestuariivita sp.]